MAQDRCRGKKSPEGCYVLRSFKFPPELWAAIEARVPPRHRSAFIRRAIERELARSGDEPKGDDRPPPKG